MKKIIYLLVILTAAANLSAQPKMVIDTGNVRLEYSLDNIQKITFKAMDRNTTLTVFPKIYFSQSYLNADITSFYFDNDTSFEKRLKIIRIKDSIVFELIQIDSIKFSQSPPIEWQKSFGGSKRDKAYSIKQTIDGGYILIGYSDSEDDDVSGNHGLNDYWILKLDSQGNIKWQESLGGKMIDEPYSIEQTEDGGYILVGNSDSEDGDVGGTHSRSYDYWVVKINNNGKIQWEKSLGGTGNDWGQSIRQTKDGGYIVAGCSESNDGDATGNHGKYDFWIVKLDSIGLIQWQRMIGGSDIDEAWSIQETTDGGYIVIGYSNSYDGDITSHCWGYDYWVVKLKENGLIQWDKSFGGTNDDLGYSIKQSNDGGYIIAGTSFLYKYGDQRDWDCFVVKIDSNSNLQWQKAYGGTGEDCAYSIQQTDDSGYIFSGYSNSDDGEVSGNNGNDDYWIVKLDVNGNLQWQKSLGGSWNDDARSIVQTNDGGYIIAGYSQSNDGDVSGHHDISSDYNYDYWIVKLSSKDTLCDSLIINYKTGQTEKIPVCQIQKITFENVNAVQEQSRQENNLSIQGNYPNPFREQTNIEFEIPSTGDVIVFIYDNFGNQIQKLECSACQTGKNSILWNCLDKNNNRVRSGVYYYEVRFGGEVQARKMVLVR